MGTQDAETVRRLEAENLRLRQALAYEARVVEAHYECYKTFPKSRRPLAVEQVERMRLAARGIWPFHYDNEVAWLRRELKTLVAQHDGEAT